LRTFSALTLVGGHLEEHPAFKKFSNEVLAGYNKVLVWLSVWSEVQMICI